MAQAVIAELRVARPDTQVVFTFFSPSAERVAHEVGADLAEYLPFDTPAAMAKLLDTLRPTAIAFVRTEIWPNLVKAASTRAIHLCMVNAVLAYGSSRLGSSARWLLRPAYERHEVVGVVVSARWRSL